MNKVIAVLSAVAVSAQTTRWIGPEAGDWTFPQRTKENFIGDVSGPTGKATSSITVCTYKTFQAMCYVKVVQPGTANMIAATDWCTEDNALSGGNNCITQTITGKMTTFTGSKMLNADYTWATGFEFTTDAGNTYQFGVQSGLEVVKLPTYGVVGNIAGMKFDNKEKMQYFAFKFDVE